MKELLEKYFAGETSQEEEQRLKDYFLSENVDEKLLPYKPLLGYFNNVQNASLDNDFEEKLLKNIDGKTKIIQLRTVRNLLIQIAAMAIVLLAVWLFYQDPLQSKSQAIDWSKYETQDPELALEQTKAALMLLSSKLNKGAEKTKEGVAKAEPIGKYLE